MAKAKPNYEKPVAALSRPQLEAEVETIKDVGEMARPMKKLEMSGLRSAVRLHRRRMGMVPE